MDLNSKVDKITSGMVMIKKLIVYPEACYTYFNINNKGVKIY
ncbi:hypothetical protein C3B55_00149 [Candidatus Pseudomonas adelgestsugas]|uniref:Uncharacterized protein n=1 Tax=Candidatus Pseudomonas adelgestsugas TaxID=1302376 RepID=A0ABX5R7V8_9PSED|nr:hypothetical protein C3B55_00149 [Candidatus Pseudomonas adelgestsugas]